MVINIIQNEEMWIQCYSVIQLYNMTYSSYNCRLREGPASRQIKKKHISIYRMSKMRHSLITFMKTDLRLSVTEKFFLFFCVLFVQNKFTVLKENLVQYCISRLIFPFTFRFILGQMKSSDRKF